MIKVADTKTGESKLVEPKSNPFEKHDCKMKDDCHGARLFGLNLPCHFSDGKRFKVEEV